jgi:lactate racemase
MQQIRLTGDYHMINEITLKQNAWFGDDLQTLKFPNHWDVELIQAPGLKALTSEQILFALNTPMGSKSLIELSRNSKKPLILIDDLTRPTPIADVLPLVLAELHKAGVPYSSITILIACGTHNGISSEDISKKLGENFPKEIRVLTHDCHDCELIGYTKSNTPIQTNRHILESDLKIGIGGIYPHPIAGFSGGGKLMALGAGGFDTIRILHDQKRGSQNRDGSIDHEFRREVNEIVKRVGFEFSINLVLNAEREVASVFCGDPELAFEKGADYYKQQFSVRSHRNPDIVISDMYPFDTDFQFAFDRGLWPFELCEKSTIKIILSSSPQGISSHELFPIKNPFFTRLIRRVRYFTLKDLWQIKYRFLAIKKTFWRRRQKVIIISSRLSQRDLAASLPKSQLVLDWNDCLQLIDSEGTKQKKTTVTIFRNSPLLLNMELKE